MESVTREALDFDWLSSVFVFFLPPPPFSLSSATWNGRREGSGLNFMSACIVVQEIAKVDPAVAVLVDIQNTLINNMLRCGGK